VGNLLPVLTDHEKPVLAAAGRREGIEPGRSFLVDVFAERPFAGNPLAVVVGSRPCPRRRCSDRADFSETTFVTSVPEQDGGYRVRMFRRRGRWLCWPSILGTAWLVRACVEPTASGPVRLNLPVGQVPVTSNAADGGTQAWFLSRR
jgi:trans-2,3-dihydro-3-hydroxyanthranilate isomerase